MFDTRRTNFSRPPRTEASGDFLRLLRLTSSLAALLLVLQVAAPVSAQAGHSVSGTVTSAGENGFLSPVASASVQVKGTSIGTLTNAQGAFALTAPTPNDTARRAGRRRRAGQSRRRGGGGDGVELS